VVALILSFSFLPYFSNRSRLLEVVTFFLKASFIPTLAAADLVILLLNLRLSQAFEKTSSAFLNANVLEQ
jgi:hypothetical protein